MAITITENTMRVNMHKTYNVQFFNGEDIYTTVTSNAAFVTSWIDDIKYLYHPPDLIVGLDIEWNPFFTAGNRNPVATHRDGQCIYFGEMDDNEWRSFLENFRKLLPEAFEERKSMDLPKHRLGSSCEF